VTRHDYQRMSELLTKYASLRLQAVDASAIALAERFDDREVARSTEPIPCRTRGLTTRLTTTTPSNGSR
jgi:hypothetical protein